jgi:glycosyltransferase involved in cell wall biosynthesis
MSRVGASGVVRDGTGIGVLQRALYPRLDAAGHDLVLTPSRDLGRGIVRTPLGMVRGFLGVPSSYEVFFSVVPPLPFGLKGRVVSVVHDLRWLETRSYLSRVYRAWDLRRTLNRSDVILCISERTRKDVLEFDPSVENKLRVAWLGPGLFAETEKIDPKSKIPGSVLLVGGAPHKRNEHAARVIAALPAGVVTRVDGVGISDEVAAILEDAPGIEVELHRHVPDAEMRRLYEQAEYFVLFSTDEGFGLPYVEALVAGCVVVCTDQPLTRELLGDAAVQLPLGSPQATADQWTKTDLPAEKDREDVRGRYSWDDFAAATVTALFGDERTHVPPEEGRP